jgi:hypothetical protein
VSPLGPAEDDLAAVVLHDPDHGLDIIRLESARDHDPDSGSLVAHAAQRTDAEVARRNRDHAAKVFQCGVRRFRVAEARAHEVHALSLCPSWAFRRYAGG